MEQTWSEREWSDDEPTGQSWGAWLLGGTAVAVVTAVTVLLVTIFADPGGSTASPAPTGSTPTGPDVAASQSAEPSEEPSPSPSSQPPSSAPASPSRKPSARVSVVPSKRPAQEVAAPKPSGVVKTSNCPTYPGPTATKAEIRTQLEAASTRVFWPTSAPSIRVPLSLLKATAWQESGWQSAILACDGGIGTMQVMPNTATFVNNRFGTSWDVNTVSGNIMLGGQYLAWLIKYMGDVYYGGFYDVTADDGLLNAVISGYQAGAAAVDPTKGSAGIPNPSYVNNVRALMTNCPCSAY